MKQNLKQFEGWAISLKHNVFLWARLKLTAMYVLIIAVILAGFSLVLFNSLSVNLSDVGEETFSGHEAHQIFLHNTLEQARNEIIIIDLIILLISAGAGYWLAGYTLKPIQKSMESQRKFSENASHELRTPLAVMKSDAEVLLRGQHPSKELINEMLRSNIEEIDRMTRMAEDLLLIARSDNRKTPQVEKTDLTHIVRETAKKIEDIAKAKNIKLDVKSEGALQVQGNNDGLQRVVINLLQNAIDHTLENGSINVALKNESNHVVIEISDTGSGIDAKDLPHIFERFYKGIGTSGNGLGLSIVKEIVDYHKGTIVITSTKNIGTKVTICFPQV